MRLTILLRTPHGGFTGGARLVLASPTITTANWKDNNHVIELTEKELGTTQ